MIEIAFLIITISIMLLVFGGIISKTFFDKIFFANCFTNQAIVMIVLLSLLTKNSTFIDIAFIYALVSFITNIAILKKYNDKE